MTSNAIYSSAPNIVLNGIKDMSTKPVTPEQETFPQHLPLFWTFAKQGNEEFNIVTGGQLALTYGAETVDANSKYCTHATPFIQGLASEGNQMMIQRLRPADAKTAWVRFSLGVTKVKLSDNAESPDGYQLRWTTSAPNYLKVLADSITNEETKKEILGSYEFGKGLDVTRIGEMGSLITSIAGAGISSAGVNQEKVYPIFDLKVTDFGDYGNNLGVRISAPNLKDNSASPPDQDLFDRILARPIRIEMVKRNNARASAFNIPTLLGETTIDVVFKPNAIDPRAGGVDQYIGTKLLDSYRDLDTSTGRLEQYGPFNELHVYEENIKHILQHLYQAEAVMDGRITSADAASSATALPGSQVEDKTLRLVSFNENVPDDELFWQMDMVNGKDFNGRPYRSFSIARFQTNQDKLSKEGSNTAILNEQFTHWAHDGSDGTMSNDVYNELVSQKLQQFNANSEWTQIARYPFSVFYDTGFPEEVKRNIPLLLLARKDISICLSTHSVPAGARAKQGVKILNRETEVSRVAGYSEMVRIYNESELFGTACCRANLIMQCGHIINSSYTGPVPLTYELAMKRARFMGSPTGNMTPGYGYDQDGMKQLKFMKQVNNTFVPQPVREKNWTNGATWAQYYDRRTMFFPAVRTVYKEETSVLLSDINMLIAVDLNKVAFRAWRRLVGNAKLSNGQFQELSDRYITEDCEGRYDGRVKIVPKTRYTPADEQRGYSWHCDINMYANNMKTVGVYTVVTHRQEDLEG